MNLDSPNLRQEFITELESILESDEAYGSNLQILTYTLKKDVINGKFKDSWNNRVYEFIVDIDGISYKPAAKLDSFSADELPIRFDAYSKGYTSLFIDVRLDRKATGKRTKKPKCGVEAFGCGYSCINLLKTCRITPSGKKIGENQGASIGKERLVKLVAKARQLNGEGDKVKALANYTQAKNIKAERDKYKAKGNARKAEQTLKQPLSNKEFKTISNAETREKLNQWAEMTAKLNKLNERRGVKGFNKERVEAAIEIIETLVDMAEYEEYNFTGIVDSKGNLQAAYVSHETEKGYYVDYLASAPWNSLESHPNKKTGAGASAMEAIVKTAIGKNKGQIELESTKNAIPFYEKIGFKRQTKKEEMYSEMTLNEEDAQKFLETQKEKNRKDTDLMLNKKIDNLTELEQLEEEVLGLFTVPQDIHRRVIEKIKSRSSDS